MKYIDCYLYKLYDSCIIAVFQGSIEEAYAELAMLNNDGFISTPNLPETNSGLTIDEMETNFPMNYALVNPTILNSTTNRPEKYNSAVLANCPQSTFNYVSSFNLNNKIEVQFNNFTSNLYPQGTYNYWTFGDGTGSFMENPSHVYTSNGDYTVRLTTFSQDCGCWDVMEQTITIADNKGKPTGQYCDPTFTYLADYSGSTSYTFSYDNSSTVYPSAPLISVSWDFGDGSTETGLVTYHTFNGIDDISVTMTATYGPVIDSLGDTLPNCIGTRTIDFNDPVEVNSCPRKDKDKVKHEPVLGDKSLTMRGKYNGNTLWGIFGGKIKAVSKFYKLKSNGNWKRQKAQRIHAEYEGSIYNIDDDGNCLENPFAVDDSDFDDNSYRVSINSPSLTGGNDNGFGADDGGIVTRHRVKFNNQFSPIYTISL